MKITLLNGNPDASNSAFDEKLHQLISCLNDRAEIQQFTLRNLEIKPCTGCFSCWVKNPGECIFQDDTQHIREKAINSDLLLFASPLIMGFTSALLKHVQDKLIPNLLPYIEFVEKECHHQKRYEKYPQIGLLYQKMNDTQEEDITTTKEMYERFTLNFRSDFVLFENIEKNMEDILHAININ